MGEAILIIGMHVIQNGLFQIDFQNDETKETYRCFIEPIELFTQIGKAMQINYERNCSGM